MFNWFRNSEKKYIQHKLLMLNIFGLLKNDFNYIFEQINEGIIKAVRNEDSPTPNFNQFSLDVKILNKFENKKGRCFAIKQLFVFDKVLNEYVEIYVDIVYGIIFGYHVDSLNIDRLDIDKIKTSNYRIVYYDDNDEYKKLLTLNERKQIAPNDFYEIELNGKTFFHIKDLEDGDFIAINKSKQLFKITHDPFEIIELQEDLQFILSSID